MKKRMFGYLVMVHVIIATMFLGGCGSSVSEKTQEATFENSALLVSTSELAATIDNANQVVIDVRSAAEYGAGHIRNAVNLPPGTFDKGGTGIDGMDLKSPAEIAAILGNAGISATTKIIICGQNVDASAGRVFWMLEYLGAKDVHVLDGGYDKWDGDGRPAVTTSPTLTAATFTPAVDGARLATKASVLANYANTTGYAIVDSRDAAHYTAKHIPKAINILVGDFLNADGTVKSYTDLKTFLDGMAITVGKSVITYCYVGYRSGQEYFILRLMGFNVSNYDGSWTEWSADLTLPTEP
jgi:3-mercaptopyruvate sulfurtransferase SseA